MLGIIKYSSVAQNQIGGIMKNFIVIVAIAFLAMSACTQKVDLEAEKAKVKAVIDQNLQMLVTEDMELMSKIYAHDDDMVFIGTDAAEYMVGWEAIKETLQKEFAGSETKKVSVRDEVIKVHDSGKVAWFSGILDWDVIAADGQAVKLEGVRATSVFEKRNGNWVFVQAHLSVPVSGQAVEY
jgi:ketosteroid isomerase-like protein